MPGDFGVHLMLKGKIQTVTFDGISTTFYKEGNLSTKDVKVTCEVGVPEYKVTYNKI